MIEVALIPGQIKVLADITSKKGEAILNIISIFLVIAIYVATFQITVKDNFNNNIGAFAELNNPKYEVMQNVDIRNYDLLFAKTGSFKAGTKLYSHGSSMEYKDTEYVEVTDGKQLGYVRAEALKTYIKKSKNVHFSQRVICSYFRKILKGGRKKEDDADIIVLCLYLSHKHPHHLLINLPILLIPHRKIDPGFLIHDALIVRKMSGSRRCRGRSPCRFHRSRRIPYCWLPDG
mgnify:CR=1 FL=1